MIDADLGDDDDEDRGGGTGGVVIQTPGVVPSLARSERTAPIDGARNKDELAVEDWRKIYALLGAVEDP